MRIWTLWRPNIVQQATKLRSRLTATPPHSPQLTAGLLQRKPKGHKLQLLTLLQLHTPPGRPIRPQKPKHPRLLNPKPNAHLPTIQLLRPMQLRSRNLMRLLLDRLIPLQLIPNPPEKPRRPKLLKLSALLPIASHAQLRMPLLPGQHQKLKLLNPKDAQLQLTLSRLPPATELRLLRPMLLMLLLLPLGRLQLRFTA